MKFHLKNFVKSFVIYFYAIFCIFPFSSILNSIFTLPLFLNLSAKDGLETKCKWA